MTATSTLSGTVARNTSRSHSIHPGNRMTPLSTPTNANPTTFTSTPNTIAFSCCCSTPAARRNRRRSWVAAIAPSPTTLATISRTMTVMSTSPYGRNPTGLGNGRGSSSVSRSRWNIADPVAATQVATAIRRRDRARADVTWREGSSSGNATNSRYRNGTQYHSPYQATATTGGPDRPDSASAAATSALAAPVHGRNPMPASTQPTRLPGTRYIRKAPTSAKGSMITARPVRVATSCDAITPATLAASSATATQRSRCAWLAVVPSGTGGVASIIGHPMSAATATHAPVGLWTRRHRADWS